MLNAIVYCRESRDDGGERYERIETQRDILLQFCRRKELKPVHIVMDDNKSGTDFGRLSVVKNWIETENIGAFVAKDTSRIGRDQLESLMFIRFLEENGVTLFLESEHYDEKLFGLFAWINERRAKEDGEKIRRVLRHKMERGELLIKAPYGYRIAEDQLVAVPEEAKKVFRIFESFSKGAGMSDLARTLEKEAPWEHWSCQKVSRILRNACYCGVYLSGRVSTVNHKRRINEKPVVIENHHQAIVPRELFESVQARLMDRKRVASHKYAGKLFCAECESSFTRRMFGTKVGFVCSGYNHSGKRRCQAHKTLESTLDEEIAFALDELLTKREKRWRKKENKVAKDKTELINEIKQIDMKTERLYEDSLLEGFPRGLFERKLREYNERKKGLEERLMMTENLRFLPIPKVVITKETLSIIAKRIAVDNQGFISIFIN